MKLHQIILCAAMLLPSLHGQETGASGKIRVLLAMEETPFKKKLIDKMKTLLMAHPTEITVIEDTKTGLQNFRASEYDLIFITNSGVWSKVRPWVTEWIDKNRADSAKILLHTTKKLKWQEDVYVDAVSSASSKKIIDTAAEEYVKKLLSKR